MAADQNIGKFLFEVVCAVTAYFSYFLCFFLVVVFNSECPTPPEPKRQFLR